jgi:hypothetical protein
MDSVIVIRIVSTVCTVAILAFLIYRRRTQIR